MYLCLAHTAQNAITEYSIMQDAMETFMIHIKVLPDRILRNNNTKEKKANTPIKTITCVMPTTNLRSA